VFLSKITCNESVSSTNRQGLPVVRSPSPTGILERTTGTSRGRYVHNAIGLSSNELIIVQREGTIEEIGAALRDVGADQGIILDNGGSVACWAWWVNAYAGGIVSPTVDYRPPETSMIAFILKGPRTIDLPGGSVSYSVA
jgi:hypothetical protein